MGSFLWETADYTGSDWRVDGTEGSLSHGRVPDMSPIDDYLILAPAKRSPVRRTAAPINGHLAALPYPVTFEDPRPGAMQGIPPSPSQFDGVRHAPSSVSGPIAGYLSGIPKMVTERCAWGEDLSERPLTSTRREPIDGDLSQVP